MGNDSLWIWYVNLKICHHVHFFCVPWYFHVDSCAFYSVGLLVTYVALNLMDGHGQPALLYIVPFTLGKVSSYDMGIIHSSSLPFCETH